MQQQKVQVETIPIKQISIVDLENCVKANVSPANNKVRLEAENYLKQLQSAEPTQYISGLAELLANSKDNNVRSFCAVLLRQSLGILDNSFDNVPSQIQLNLQKLLLQLTQTETDRNVLIQVTEALGALACKILHHRKWPELIPFLMELSKSSNARHREAFLIVLDKLAEFALDILLPDIANIQQMLVGLMQDNNEQVRIAGLKSTITLLLSLDEKNDLPKWRDITPLLFKNLSVAIAKDKNGKYINLDNSNKIQLWNSVLSKACEQLLYFTENRGDFFNKHLKPIIQTLGQVVDCSLLEWETRRLAMDLLTTLMETNIDILESNEDFHEISNKIIPLCFLFVHNFDDTLLDSWNTPDDIQDQTNYSFGCEMLTKIALLVDIQLFWELCYKNILIKGFQQNSDWRDRLTALTTIERCIDACASLFLIETTEAAAIAAITNNNNNNNDNGSGDSKSDDFGNVNINDEEDIGEEIIDRSKLDDIVTASGQSLSHSNPYVRYKALIVIKSLSVTFSEYGFLDYYHQPIMNALNSMLANSSNNNNKEHRCVKSQVCDSLAHIAYYMEPEMIAQYAESSLKVLHNLLQVNDRLVQSMAFKAVSVIAQQLETDDNGNGGFSKYYDTFMTISVNTIGKVVKDTNNSDAATLRGRAMECIGQILMSVCNSDNTNNNNNNTNNNNNIKEKYVNDAHKVMKLLLPYYDKEHKAGLESYNFMNQLFADIATAIGSNQFRPYIKPIITKLIESTKLQVTTIKDVTNDIQNNPFNGSNNENDSKNANGAATAALSSISQVFHLHKFGDKHVTLNTSGFYEKKSAVSQLLRYCESIGDQLFDYVEAICNGLLPIVSKRGDSEMRQNAVRTIPSLVKIYENGLKYKNATKEQYCGMMNGILNQVVPKILDSLIIEEDVNGYVEICEDLIIILKNYVNINNGINLTNETLTDITQQIGNAITERLMRRESSLSSTPANDTPNNEETNDNNANGNGNGNSTGTGTSSVNNGNTGNGGVRDSSVIQAEADLANTLCNLIEIMAKLFGSQFIDAYNKEGCYDATIGLFKPKLTNESDWSFGLNIFAELILYGGKSGSQYIPDILGKCNNYLKNNHFMNNLPKSSELKQSISYTIGNIALVKKYHKHLNPTFWSNLLKSIIIDQHNKSDNPFASNNLSRDNAVSAIGKILDNYWNEMVCNGNGNNDNSQIDIKPIYTWINLLPIIEDIEEREYCNKFLLKILSLNNAIILNQLIQQFNNNIILKLIEIISISIINQDTQCNEFKSMLQHITNKYGNKMIQQCISQLPNEYQQAFN